MTNNKTTGAAIDILLKLVVGGSVLGTALVAPNAIQSLDKPLQKFFNRMDVRERERKLAKIKNYMKTQGLVRHDYDHGLILTNKGQNRFEKLGFKDLHIAIPIKWDHNWRIIMFDIPEKFRDRRVALTRKIGLLGFQPLQQSVWVYPFACRNEIELVCEHFRVSRYVTYIETAHIDREDRLVSRFKNILG